MDLETGAVADPPAETLAEMYAMLIRARKLDERCWILHRQGKIGFHISGMGHEAAQIGIAWAMRRGYDMLHPYYRDLAMVLACGMPLTDVLLGSFGRKATRPRAGGRCPTTIAINRGMSSACRARSAQLPQAAGLALAEQLSGGDRVVITCLGEGSTSEGDFHEAMIWAGVRKLPLVVVVENNEYAISVPMRQQMAIERVSDRAGGYGVRGVSVDGLDMLASYRVAREAIDIARSGGGSTLLEARVVRLTPHSSDDNDTTYRSVEEKIALKAKDPLPRVRASLIARGALTEAQALDIEERALIEVDAAHRAAGRPYPPNAWALGPVFAGSGDGHG
jgi:2-oxoisovalerate dehydrogenase E1 component alpha subunit